MWGKNYLKAYADHPSCEIVGLVDRARDRRDAFAKLHGISATYDNLEELLVREVPDIVSAIVPVGQNHPVVTACAEAGVRAVSCEKPLSASLSEADEIVRFCRERGTLLGCGQAGIATPYMPEVVDWVRDGNIGTLTAAAIPGGLPMEVSGGGCVQLAATRILTGMEVEWVEGWTLPSEEGYAEPETAAIEADCPAYGRLGLSGGIVCEIGEPAKERHIACVVAVQGEDGHVWLCGHEPVMVAGTAAASTPVRPSFMKEPDPEFFDRTITRLMHAFDTGEEPRSSGHDMRQSLEIAIAIKLSAHNGHERIPLPLEDRSHRLLPHRYRLVGGDIAGYESIGYLGPPAPPEPLPPIDAFSELVDFTDHNLQQVLRHLDQEYLTLALVRSDESLKERILNNMSRRVRPRITEQIQTKMDEPPESIDAAQKRIVEMVCSLSREQP